MPIVAVRYTYVDDTDAVAAARPEHREFLAAQAALRMSGPTDDNGALLIFEGEPAEVEALTDRDPFVRDGLVAERTVVTWNVVLGSWREQLGL